LAENQQHKRKREKQKCYSFRKYNSLKEIRSMKERAVGNEWQKQFCFT
jgi:hypothetical protein